MGVFSKNNQPETNVKRNAFDGSFQNNLTMKMGYLYPCLCKEVVPGDTFRINSAFGLRFMPTAFPLQTKIKAHIDFFYVRNRNLWDKWNNYYTAIGPNDGFPVLSPTQASEQIRTGSLGDYLGLPSTVVGKIPTINLVPVFPTRQGTTSGGSGVSENNLDFDLVLSSIGQYSNKVNADGDFAFSFISFVSPNLLSDDPSVFPSSLIPSQLQSKYVDGRQYYIIPCDNIPTWFKSLTGFEGAPVASQALWPAVSNASKFTWSLGLMNAQTGISDTNPQPLATFVRYIDGQLAVNASLFVGNTTDKYLLSFFQGGVGSKIIDVPSDSVSLYTRNDNQLIFTTSAAPHFYKDGTTEQVLEASTYLSQPPFNISALPFRAYEQIYNSFYRDDRNNPLLVDGVLDPNRFLPNLNGGVDNTSYVLRKRNWEQDFLTTALPSPQFGNAPLVGISSSGVATFADADGNTISSQLSVDSDGDTVVGFSSTSDPNVNNTLIKLASSGISINDLRGVNSLQRYLETKYRIGLRYRDQIKAHFGVDIKQDILDMPEFIGSISQMVDVSQVNQTSATTDSDPLGSYAGQLSCIGSREHGFQKYCDEQGYIIGIISVVPVPCYSQLCPKHFLKTNEPLDFFFPEFNHLGYQPIKYNEVAPYQAILNGVSVNDTFGYQRAWYDYLSNVDEVHGQFRTTLNNFVLSRVYNSVPSLNEEFLTVDPDSLNDVFTVNEVDGEPVDTILGQIHFDITMMRPISRFGVPRLE